MTLVDGPVLRLKCSFWRPDNFTAAATKHKLLNTHIPHTCLFLAQNLKYAYSIYTSSEGFIFLYGHGHPFRKCPNPKHANAYSRIESIIEEDTFDVVGNNGCTGKVAAQPVDQIKEHRCQQHNQPVCQREKPLNKQKNPFAQKK